MPEVVDAEELRRRMRAMLLLRRSRAARAAVESAGRGAAPTPAPRGVGDALAAQPGAAEAADAGPAGSAQPAAPIRGGEPAPASVEAKPDMPGAAPVAREPVPGEWLVEVEEASPPPPAAHVEPPTAGRVETPLGPGEILEPSRPSRAQPPAPRGPRPASRGARGPRGARGRRVAAAGRPAELLVAGGRVAAAVLPVEGGYVVVQRAGQRVLDEARLVEQGFEPVTVVVGGRALRGFFLAAGDLFELNARLCPAAATLVTVRAGGVEAPLC